jgi:hypothetical protein
LALKLLIFSFRSFNFCGKNNVCCRLQKSTEKPSTTTQKIFASTTKITTTTARKGLLNFISTILKPVAPSQPQLNLPVVTLPQKCVSRKGKKIEKRILIDADYDEDEAENDDGPLVGETTFAEYPWMIEILKKNRKTNNFEYKCGGVLSENYFFLIFSQSNDSFNSKSLSGQKNTPGASKIC